MSVLLVGAGCVALALAIGRPGPAVVILIAGTSVLLYLTSGRTPEVVRHIVGGLAGPAAALVIVAGILGREEYGSAAEAIGGLAAALFGGWAAGLAVLRLGRRVSREPVAEHQLSAVAYESDSVAAFALVFAVLFGAVIEAISGQFLVGFAIVSAGTLTLRTRAVLDHPAAVLILTASVALGVVAIITAALTASSPPPYRAPPDFKIPSYVPAWRSYDPPRTAPTPHPLFRTPSAPPSHG